MIVTLYATMWSRARNLSRLECLKQPPQQVSPRQRHRDLCRARGYAESFCFSGRKWLTGRSFLA